MIITESKENNGKFQYLNIFPDQFKPEKEKLENPDTVKNTMDYFANIAYAQYLHNRETFVRNYELLKGILRPEDFYQDPQVKSFTQLLMDGDELPSYVKHYSILNPPINTMVGEQSHRPDLYKAKAFDDESKSEELEFKTQIYQQFVIEQAKQQILQDAQMQGQTPSDEELSQLTMQKVQDYLTDYTSMAERWANHVITGAKVMFNMKEKSEEAFRDLLVSSREFFHIIRDTSKLGIKVVVENPKNVWRMTVDNKKYTVEDYAAGTVKVMEISEIIEEFPDLTKEEIDHLRKQMDDLGYPLGRETTLNRNISGNNSIEYDTYYPVAMQEQQILEAEMMLEGDDGMSDIFGRGHAAFGHKFVVVRAYWKSKQLVKGVTYKDMEGKIQFMLTDESYINGSHPGEISVEEGWVNVWYQGDKIGPEVYHTKPLKILDYCPIIGVVHESKNTEAKSLVDLLKPFQILYNVCMNQLFRLLEKEIGRVLLTPLRHIPIPKDGDAQDAIELWEEEARRRGVLFVDDSPENTKVPSSFNQYSAQDLTRTNEIQSRYQLAVQLKNEAWELVGITRQRLGGSSGATETATQTQTGLQQSFTQTEPLFVQHEYVMGMVYQAIVDAFQYLESQKEVSTISYISNQGEAAFIQVNGSDIKMRDLMVFMTARAEDQQIFNELRQLSQAMLQNGASAYEVVELYTTNSVRQMKKIFKDLKEKQEEFAQRQQEMEQQQIEAQQQQVAMTLKAQADEKERDRIQESAENQLDRLNKKEVALIGALSKNPNATADNDNSGLSDALEITNQSQAAHQARKEQEIKSQEIARKAKADQDKVFLELEKMALEREKIQKDLKVEKMKLQNPVAGEKPKSKPKKKK